MSAPPASAESDSTEVERSVAWRVMHWVVAIAPFVLVLALSIWGFGKYAWVPFVAGILCPVGAALVGLNLKRGHSESKRRLEATE